MLEHTPRASKDIRQRVRVAAWGVFRIEDVLGDFLLLQGWNAERARREIDICLGTKPPAETNAVAQILSYAWSQGPLGGAVFGLHSRALSPLLTI